MHAYHILIGCPFVMLPANLWFHYQWISHPTWNFNFTGI